MFFFVINVNDCATKFKFGDGYDCYHSRKDNIMRAMDAVIDRKRALVCSHDDVGEVVLSIFVTLVLVCSLPIVTLPAVIPPSDGDKCASAFRREGDGLDD